MSEYDAPSDFENTLSDFVLWALVIGLLVWIYRSKEGRLVGWIIGLVILLIGLYREFFTVFSSGQYFASALVILGTCLVSRGRAHHRPQEPP